MSLGVVIGLGSLFGVGVISSVAAMSGDKKKEDETKEGLFNNEKPYLPPLKPKHEPELAPLPSIPKEKADGGYTGYYGGKKSKSKKNRNGKKKSVKKGKKKSHKKKH